MVACPEHIELIFVSGVFRIWQRGHGERAEREPMTGVKGKGKGKGCQFV